ncbi:hypothetical protein GOB57_24685 [Sinorhizobium meliloti]|nr:hypothetical protein [Sinorhizobium meliloti]
MASRLTDKRLNAIIEALIFRTAGEIECEDGDALLRCEDYDAALEWALSELERRKSTGVSGRS